MMGCCCCWAGNAIGATLIHPNDQRSPLECSAMISFSSISWQTSAWPNSYSWGSEWCLCPRSAFRCGPADIWCESFVPYSSPSIFLCSFHNMCDRMRARASVGSARWIPARKESIIVPSPLINIDSKRMCAAVYIPQKRSWLGRLAYEEEME